MIAAKIEAMVENDGELHLTHLPCRKGDRVEAIVLILREGGTEENGDEASREEARNRFLAKARASTFRSDGAYPSRDELHERH